MSDTINARFNLFAAVRPDMHADIEAKLASEGVPATIADSLVHYLRYGRPVGGFLTAVLEGHLFEAATRADEDNRKALGDIARAIVWFFPNAAYGSPEKVERWREAAVKGNPDLIR